LRRTVWLPVIGGFLANVIFGAFVGSFSTLLPSMLQDVGAPLSEGGLIGSAFFTGYLISQVPFAMLAERLGVVRVVSSGLVVYTILHFVFATSSTWNEILFYRFLQGFLGGAVFIPTLQLAFEVGDERRSFATGFVASGFNAGTGLGAYYSFAASGGKWQTGLISATLVFAALIPVASTLIFTARRRRQEKRPTDFSKDSGFYFLNILHFVRLGVIIATTTWMPTALASLHGLSEGSAAFYSSILQLTGIVSLTVGGYVTDMLGKGRVLVMNVAALSAALAVSQSVPVWLLPLYVALLGFLIYLPTPAAFAILRDRYHAGGASVAAGYLNTSAAAGAIMMPYLFGVLHDVFKGFASSFYLTAALYLILLPLIPTLTKKQLKQ
jgi:MFS family permease